MPSYQRMRFLDRRDAGRQLAAQLSGLADQDPVVIALPRGGVPVGFEVAQALGAPLDVLAVRKLGAPGNPEFGVGAIAEDGTEVLNAAAVRRVGMTEDILEETIKVEGRELRRRVERYRDGRQPFDVRGRTVIVVDDGLATGVTDLAAVRALRARGAAKIIVAVPVGPRESVALVGGEADGIVCHTIPGDFVGVGRWYQDFSPVSDAEVLALLDELQPSNHLGAPAQAPPRERRSVAAAHVVTRELLLNIGGVVLAGDLTLPADPAALVIFAHGSGSSRLSPRNREVATAINQAGLATLLFDLLTEDEGRRREPVFDIALLGRRLEGVTRWAIDEPDTRGLPVGYFGASTGAAGALHAAAAVGDAVGAVVSRGGRPDLAADRLPDVTAPTLLLVGGRDAEILELNRRAASMLCCEQRLVVVEGAGHLFTEPGTLERVAELATDWFREHLVAGRSRLTVAGR